MRETLQRSLVVWWFKNLNICFFRKIAGLKHIGFCSNCSPRTPNVFAHYFEMFFSNVIGAYFPLFLLSFCYIRCIFVCYLHHRFITIKPIIIRIIRFYCKKILFFNLQMCFLLIIYFVRKATPKNLTSAIHQLVRLAGCGLINCNPDERMAILYRFVPFAICISSGLT